MVGYIINVQRAHDEDVIVTVLTAQGLHTLYRFYGARHSTVNLGYKIDFEIQEDSSTSMPRLRHIKHLGFTWIGEMYRMLIWQQLCQLFYTHLKESETLEDFYFNLLDHAALLWSLQNPKRITVELYSKILRFEGRLHLNDSCFICELPIVNEDPALVRAFLPTHAHCSYANTFPKQALQTLFHEHSSITLDDTQVEALYDIVAEGF